MITDVLNAVFVIGGLGLLFGAGLGFAGKRFATEENETVNRINQALPGANCGGCGYAGCGQLADAIFKGAAGCDACPVGGATVAETIAGIMGVAVTHSVPMMAYVKCAGGESEAANNYKYADLQDCKTASALTGGGAKGCKYGCLGLGSCVKACAFDAIIIENGIARVDAEKCVACQKCVAECPRKIIEMVPRDKTVRVACNSLDNGKTVKACCSVGCISCKLCEKACAYDAVKVENMLSHIDYEKCVMCGECVKKCPTKIIRHC